MAVRVRLFAALREAAGVADDVLPPGRLGELLDTLCARYGEEFARYLHASTVLLNGDSVRGQDDLLVRDGAELALLPPVSGGTRCR